ncbi:hypothetical protein BGZ83_008693 [Gryganskiella cystojenkinii]|nr:hypothetical protein BGZ83_008693 [Gryganskiella cystojenkinii]
MPTSPQPQVQSSLHSTRGKGTPKGASVLGTGPAPMHPHTHHRFPEPIVYQFTLYYPGNMPLVVTAGHGGSTTPGKVVSRKMTHRFTPIANLEEQGLLTFESFSKPVHKKSSLSENVQHEEEGEGEETMPWMPQRDQTKGGNFKRDLNTHAMALNLANAVSCLTSGPVVDSEGDFTSNVVQTKSMDSPSLVDTITDSSEIPPHCRAQGPWGNDDADYPLIWTTTTPGPAAATPPPIPSTVNMPLLTRSPLRKQKRAATRRYQHYYPHVIVFRVHRIYVDVNRNITGENAIAEGHPVSEAAWREYHDLIDHVQAMVVQQQEIVAETNETGPSLDLFMGPKGVQTPFGGKRVPRPVATHQEDSMFQGPSIPTPSSRGLLLDIHGHTHSTNLIEIGYLLNGSVLAMSDAKLDAHARTLTREASIRSLITYLRQQEEETDTKHSSPISGSNPSSLSPSSSSIPSTPGSLPPTSMSSPSSLNIDPVPFSRRIRGANESLGGMFQRQGLNSLPSPSNPSPCQECSYFFGGYTIQQHGTRDRETALDAIQLELPKTVRLVDKEEGRELGMKLGRAVVEYMTRYYGLLPLNVETASVQKSVHSLGLSDIVGSGSDNKVHDGGPVLGVQPDIIRKKISGQMSAIVQQERRHAHRYGSAIGANNDRREDDNNSGDSEVEELAKNPSKGSSRTRPKTNRQSSSRL